MISRNVIRIKVMQAIYEYNMSQCCEVAVVRRNLLRSFDDMYMLYVRVLSMFSALTSVAEQIIELKKQKYLPTETDLHPNLKFINNSFISKLEENKPLQRLITENNLSWNNDVDLLFVRKVYDAMSNKDFFIEYMQNHTTSFDEDKKLILDVLELFMLENEEMMSYFDEIKLSWGHDYNDVIIFIHNTLKTFTKNQSEEKKLPPLFKIDKDGVCEDKQFALDLCKKTLANNAYYEQIVSEKLRNWEADRIACVDFILIKMAICEFCEFPNIPLRVTLNEYIEISKYYSTPKSRYFINGLLDSILKVLRKDDKINKQGRGLMG